MNLILKAEIVRKYGTQADFAQVIKKDESVVSRVIRGRKSLSSSDQSKWAEKLGQPKKQLF